jgi:signal transduction histidine kinase
MLLQKLARAWKKERLGLIMITAALAVISVTIVLLLRYQQRDTLMHMNEQGSSLARILSRIPYAQFVSAPGRAGMLAVLQQTQQGSGLAYLAVLDTRGKPVEEVAAGGIEIPAMALPADPTGWIGQRKVRLPVDGASVIEYHAPLFDGGTLAGHVLLGYFTPEVGLSRAQITTVASFALPIFLLTTLCYLLLRREVHPLRQVNGRLESLLNRDTPATARYQPDADMQAFIGRCNQFIEVAQSRIQRLETDRSKLETSTKLLSYRRTRIESVLQSFPDGLVVLDEGGAAILCNSAATRLLDVPADRIVGHRPGKWCNERGLLQFLMHVSGENNQGLRVESLEFAPAAMPDKTFAVTSCPMFSPQDSTILTGTLLVFRDVSENKLVRNIGAEFVAHVSHELKTPLNVLSMYSEMLQGEDGKDPAFRIEAANVIHDEVERVALLINNILSITKIESGTIAIERKRVRLRELLEDTFNACARSGHGKRLGFKLDLPRDISPVALDKELIRIAINNLLTNAIKYSNDDGLVRLAAEEIEQTVRITVQDTGIGIAAEEQEHIFDKFYRSQGPAMEGRSGHGLGLALVREIVHLHHGTLTVRSTPGAGSEFVIEFNKESGLLKEAV